MPTPELRIEDLIETTKNIGEWIAKVRDVLRTGDPDRVIAVDNGTNITAAHLVTSLDYVRAWADAVRQALDAVEDKAAVKFMVHPEIPYPVGGSLGKIATCPKPGPIYGPQCQIKILDLHPPDLESTT